VHDLSISLLSRENHGIKDTTSTKSRSTKTRAAGLEILSGAHLRIKSGGRYGFIGRNGSGKSSLLFPIVLVKDERPNQEQPFSCRFPKSSFLRYR
jgi:ATPase subunit of ABC transporter with duplicated ATPase domains